MNTQGVLTSIEKPLDPTDSVFTKPSLVQILVTQRSMMEVIPPFLLEPSFMIAADIFEGPLALVLGSFSNDIIPVTLQCLVSLGLS